MPDYERFKYLAGRFNLDISHIPKQVFEGDDTIPLALGLDLGVLLRNGWNVGITYDKLAKNMEYEIVADRGDWRLIYRCSDEATGKATDMEIRELLEDDRYRKIGILTRDDMLTVAKMTDEQIRIVRDKNFGGKNAR